jgi:hypothetical protein
MSIVESFRSGARLAAGVGRRAPDWLRGRWNRWGKLERLRHATQRTHPGRGRRERDLHVIMPVSAPATPKQTARDEARARAPEQARGLPHRFGQVAEGRFAIGDPQENAQVEGTQVLAVDRL